MSDKTPAAWYLGWAAWWTQSASQLRSVRGQESRSEGLRAVPDAASHAALSLPEMRELLTDLHHEIDNQGGREGELFQRAEETIRWLLDRYLERGEHIADGE